MQISLANGEGGGLGRQEAVLGWLDGEGGVACVQGWLEGYGGGMR